ncbi:methyltransferase domain-containing protein [Amycolatopsis sp. NPDC049868]|uniref:methyltransferase domain-containing protein n=1 Tax=Amycolatopsis sp. NPDC049868 TaxID=3363934 RepID=UPI0037AF8622
MSGCRVCHGVVTPFLDLGKQPLSDAFPADAEEAEKEYFYNLRVGSCRSCSMVQLIDEVPREQMFNDGYPYRSSLSSVMRDHFERTARELLDTELSGPDPFLVELGCNDGVLLRTVAGRGVRHLGVEPSAGVAELARSTNVSVLTDFFEERTARRVHAEHGQADVVYAANTFCHIPYLDSVFAGLDVLLKPDGVLVFEDPYLGDIVDRASFDQIYDEHFYLFSAKSVAAMAHRFGFELVDVERLPVHGGEVRYRVARAGARTPSPAVADLLAEEDRRALHAPATLEDFARRVDRICDDLVSLLERLRGEGKRVVAYGATAKSATVTNRAGIGPTLVETVYDSTPEKQGRLTPGAHIPVAASTGFADPYPDFALLFAWNHADEIMRRESVFRESGGKWILYVPDVRVV